MADPVLEFTGERFTPECVREIWYEHWHRYAFALLLARGRRVLDAACGEGYGSGLLANVAADVVGVDIDAAAIAHAQRRYGERSGLRFVQADVTALDALPDAAFDLVTSFETLEHVEAQERMLDGFARVLTQDGVLLVSTPDKRTYSDLTGFRNEFHVRELYRDEFEAMLRARFPAVRLFGQQLMFQSVLAADDGSRCAAATLAADGTVGAGFGGAPLYFVAACARTPDAFAALGDVHLFADAAQSVYSHYNGEIRKNIAAGHRILELEQQLAAAQAELAALQAARNP